MESIQRLQEKLLAYIGEGQLELLFKSLKKLLPFESDLYDKLILLESRYRSNKNQLLIENTISKQEADLGLNKVKQGLIHFVKELSWEDLKIDEDQAQIILNECIKENEKKGDNNNEGCILHRIPGKMEINKPVKCFVRIAFEELHLLKNFTLDEYAVIERKTIGNIIDVCLEELEGDEFFKIRTITDSEQFIDRDGHTEWIFYVTPLKEGINSLFLKVAVIEKIDGKERRKNIIIDKEIEIVTDEVSLAEGDKSKTAIPFALSIFPASIGEISPSPPPSSPPTFIPNLINMLGGGKAIAVLVPLLFAGSIFTANWWKEIKYQQAEILITDSCVYRLMEEFSPNYPRRWYYYWKNDLNDSAEIKHPETLWMKVLNIQNDKNCKAYRAFLEKCPNSVLDSLKGVLKGLCMPFLGPIDSINLKDTAVLDTLKNIPGEQGLKLDLQKVEDSLIVDVSGGVAPYHWRIFMESEKSMVGNGEYSDSGRYKMSLDECCEKPVEYIFEVRDATKNVEKDYFKRKETDEFGPSDSTGTISPSPPSPPRLALGVNQNQNNLIINIIGGKPPYIVNISKDGKTKITEKYALKGQHEIDKKPSLEKGKLYKILLTDSLKGQTSASIVLSVGANIEGTRGIFDLDDSDPEAYYLLLKKQDSLWVKHAKIQNPVLQVAAFKSEEKAFNAAVCLQEEGIDKRIYIYYIRDVPEKYKILISGFKNRKKAKEYHQENFKENICIKCEIIKEEDPYFFPLNESARD